MHEEDEFKKLGFVKETDGDDNPVYGNKKQPIYVKGFYIKHNQMFSLCKILGSRDPDTKEYELHVDCTDHLNERDTISSEKQFNTRLENDHLEKILKEFKEQKNIPTNVALEIKAKYYFSAGPKLKGADINKIYTDLEQVLIALNYIESSIRDKKSFIIKGSQVGLL